nr:maco-A 80 [Mamestra configurata nucleopolyhedrovirus A]WRQ96316.1 maco-A 80 [Mamestra configurata nucleopolyhedrovirus A]WRQ96485.1 maco-A 80 [Mamestra configurata nucleopolyhedrovirus A]
MTCSFNIAVYISDRFFAFPYDRVEPQHDVGGALVRKLIVYVPTEEDVKFVNTAYIKNFDYIAVQRQEYNERHESHSPEKKPNFTIVYWNPIFPIVEIGAGNTLVFSMMLTDSLFYCKTMVVDSNNPVCPIQYLTRTLRDYIPIAGESPLDHFNTLTDDNKNNFLICFLRETPRKIRQLNVKRILTILEYRKIPAKFAFEMSDADVQEIYIELKNELVRRLIKGDTNAHCPYLNIPNLNFIKRAQQLLLIPDSSQTVVTFISMFQILVLPYQIVPEIIIKLNSIDRKRNVRLYCKNDSLAITSFGAVPNNMVEDNPVSFDYADVNTPYHLNTMRDKLYEATRIDNLIVSAARYNYFF